MSDYRAVFRCIAGCGEEYPLDEVVYECRKCGNLLEVSHDLDKLSRHERTRVAAALRQPHRHQRVALRERHLEQEGMGGARR